MSSLVTLNGGTLDNTNSTLNVNKSNIILMQNYGISGGITDISRNMFTITNSSISIKNINNNLGFNNIWTGKNTFKGDVSFNNTNTIIDASNTINLRSSTVNISGGTVNISGGTITLGSSNIVLPNIQPQKKNNVVFFDTATSALSYGTATSFSDDVSFNNAKTQINSTSVVGLSGGTVNISGGTISLGSSNIVLPNIQSQKKNNVVFFDTTSKALSYGTATSFSDDVSFNNANTQINSTSVIGLSGGVVNISGGAVTIGNGTLNIGSATMLNGPTTLVGATTINGNTTIGGTTTVSGNVTFNNATTQISSTSVVGLSGGTVNISGGIVNIAGSTTLSGTLNLPSITNKTTGQSTYSSVIYNPTSSEVSHSSQMVQKPISNTTLSIAQQFIVGVMNGANTVNYGSFASISSDGNTLAVSAYGSNSVYMYTRTGSSWNTGSPQIITGPSGSLVFSKIAVSLSKDGNTLAVGDTNKNTAYIYTKSGATTWNTTPSFSPTGPNQYFGSCVALSSDGYTFAVGDWSTNGVYIYSRTSSTTWNATPTKLICMYNGISFPTLLSFSDDGNTLAVGAYSGRLVFIYSRTSSTWNTVPQTIGAPYDYGTFGTSVSISSDGNTLAIGDDQGGCAFIYKRIGGYWNKQPFATFINDNGGQYGWSVSLSNDGNTLAVGATGIKTIYVYRCVNNVWDTNPKIRYTESSNQSIGYPVVLSGDGTTLGAGTSNAGNYFYVYSITPTNTILGNGIGIGVNSQTKYTLDVSGDVNLNNTLYTNNNKTTFTQIYTYDYAAITAHALTGLGCSALSPDGNMIAFCSPNDLDYMLPANGGYGGIVKVYKRYGAIWTQYGQQLTSSQSGSYFGRMSCFSNDGKLAISAPFMANYGTTTRAGTVYIYYYNNTTNQWTLINTIGYGTSYYQFGFSLAFSLDGNTLAIGGSGHANNTYTGTVQIHKYNGNIYDTSQSLVYPTPLANTSFGHSVALSDDGNILAVGAPGNGSSNVGTVWIYRRSGSTWGSNPYSFNITTSGYLWIGIEVSLSGDGNTIAIQCSTSSGGAVLIYTYDGTNWNLKQTINTNSIMTDSKTLALSKDAMKLYVCQNYNTFFYEYDTTTNLYVKNDIGGILYPTKTCVSMSYDSRTIALGNQSWNNGSNGGRIDIFEIETTKQLTIANELFIGTPGSKGVIYMGGGALGDNGYQHSVIESRNYSGGESSELLLFKGNDNADRIRLRGGQICFDTYNPTGNINRTDENIKMTITNGGNVGIGTASPGAKLEVLGNERTSSILVKGTQPGIVLNNTSTNGKNFNIWSTSSADGPGVGKLAIYDETSGAYRMLINESGNVGIGTISPNTKLELKSSLSNILNKNFGTNSDARWSSNWGLSIVNEYTDNNLANASNTGNNTRPALGLGLSTGLYPTAYITSLTPHGFNGWNPLMIDGGKVCFNVNSGGNVGIGTANPSAKLGVLAPNGSYTNGEGNTTNAFEFYTGEEYNVDMTLYGGCDKTNKLCYLQSVIWGYQVAPLALNLRGGNTLVGGSLYLYNSNRLYLNSSSTFSCGVYSGGNNAFFGYGDPASSANYANFNCDSANTAVSGSGAFYMNNQGGMSLGDRPIYLRNETNHYLRYNSARDGPRLAGWVGGQIGYTSGGSFQTSLEWAGYSVATKKLTVSSDSNTNNVGVFSVQVSSQSQSPDIADWNDNFVLFGYSNTGQLGSRSGGLGFCRYSSTDNWLVSLQPSISWNNIHFAQNVFFIHQYGTTSYASHYFTNYEFWCNFSNGATFATLRPTGYDRFLVHQNTSQTNYFYYNQNNTIGTASDARIKKDITAIDVSKSKEFITKITPSVYRYINGEDDTKHLGFIAQDVLVCAKTEAQKNIVNHWKEYEEQNGDPYEEYEDQNDKDEDGKPKKKTRKVYLGVSQVSIIPEIIGCIQVMNKENEELKTEVVSQNNQIQTNNTKIQELENKVAMLEQQNLSFQSQTLSLQSEIMILQNKNSSLESQIQSQTSSLQEQITAILAKIGM